MNTQKSNDNYEQFIGETLPLIKQVAQNNHIPPIYMPINDMSEISFSGYNKAKLMLSTMANGFDDNRWITEKQLQEKYPDLSIPENAKPTSILRSEKHHFEIGENGKVAELSKEEFEQRRIQASEHGEKSNAFYSFEHSAYNIYNASQIPNYPKQDKMELSKSDTHELIENFVASSGVKLVLHNQEHNNYNPKNDSIEMNALSFASRDEYYARLLENFFIATGHENREARNVENINDVFAESVKSNMFALMASSHFGLEGTQKYASNLIDLIDRSAYSNEQLMKASFEANKMISVLEQYCTGDTVQAHWFPHHTEWAELIKEAQKEANSPMPENWKNAEYLEGKKGLQTSIETNTSHAVVLRIYLDVPREEKEEAKALGAKWDSNEKSWYTMSDNPNKDKLFEKWQKKDIEQTKIFLNVPKEEKDFAKALGAKWDNKEKLWYTTNKNPQNQELFEKYSQNQAQKSEVKQNDKPEQIYLNVSRDEKDMAKSLGAKWDRKAVAWYTTSDNPHNESLFSLYTKQDRNTLATEQIEKARELFRDKNFLDAISSLGDSKKIQTAIGIITDAVNSPKQAVRQKM